VAIAICEDLWQEGGPVALTREAGAELLLVINGSPYEQDKDDVRYELVARRAAQAGCTLAYLNMVGARDVDATEWTAIKDVVSPGRSRCQGLLRTVDTGSSPHGERPRLTVVPVRQTTKVTV